MRVSHKKNMSTRMIKEFWSLHLPRATYRKGRNYYGTFPEGFIKELMALNIVKSPTVNLCSGESDFGDMRIDILSLENVIRIGDARKTGLPDGYANFVLIDPYYTREDYEKVGQEYVSVYDFLKEAYRICKFDGSIGVLHTRPPRKPKGTILTHLIAISMGPDRQLRCFQIFKRVA